MSNSIEANKFLKEGAIQYAKGNYYAAIDCYKQALKIFQNKNNYYGESQAFLEIAKIYQHFSQWAIYDAQKYFSMIIKGDSDILNPNMTNASDIVHGTDGDSGVVPPDVISEPPPPPPSPSRIEP
jgi:tetratricopeptide (TPR) repeat protein